MSNLWIRIFAVAAAALGVFWVERAEAHEGENVPKGMTPPSKEDIAEELQCLYPPSPSLCESESSTESSSDSSSDEAEKEKDDADPGLIWREEDGKSVLVKKFFMPRRRNFKEMKLTMKEVEKHNTRDDCWIVIESRCYDITKYVDVHPGGWLPLQNMAGKDCTDAFANYHPASVYEKLLPRFYIGYVTDTLDSLEFTKGHREIRQELLRRGLFETNEYYYYLKITWLLLLWVASVYCTLLPDSPSLHKLGAVLMAIFWQQLAFVGHDVGHNAISHKKWKDTFIGVLLGNTFGGISLGWWKRSHNVHHIVCNSIEHDPDIQHMPIFAVTDDIFDKDKLRKAGVYDEKKKGFWTSYHDHFISADFASSLLVSYQHWLFYPIMAVARFNLYIQGWIFCIMAWKQDAWYAKRYQALEFGTLTTFLVWMVCLVMSLPSNERLSWLLISHSIAGILHVQICLSHFTMDTYHGHAYNDVKDEWFTMQCVTTMNVDTYRCMDFIHGGLQFQIEHHLFPRLPRHNLREARALVKPFAEKWGIRYHEQGFIDCNKELVNGLRSVAHKCRKYGIKAVGGFENTQLYDGLHAEG